jgi:hypothetical protein
VPYHIEFQEDPPLLKLKLWGFWNTATVAVFARDIEDVRAENLKRLGKFDTLADAAEMRVQSLAVIERFQLMQQLARSLNAGRVAIVVGGMLPGLQAKRKIADATTAVFSTVDDALAWLRQPSAKHQTG